MKFFVYLLVLTACLSAYERPPSVGEAQWDFTAPYFLPENHSAKPILDKLFSKDRPTASIDALYDAGFKKVSFNEKTGMYVMRHSKLKGYVIKLYTDDWAGVCDWCMWVKRVKGAQAIRQAIDAHGYQNNFDVPQKWVYPLPYSTYPANAIQAKDFVMLVEDSEPYDYFHNSLMWHSKLVDQVRLQQFFTLLNEVGLYDSIYIDNVPFNKKGKIVFLDTEHYHEWPVPLQKVANFLTKRMAAYWFTLF